MRSPRSCGFFKPANTIFVPGMYFFGFSRYSKRVSLFQVIPVETYEYLVSQYSIIIITLLLRIVIINSSFTLSLVGICVGIACSLTSFPANQTIQIWANFVFATGLNSVALSAPLNEDLKTNKLVNIYVQNICKVLFIMQEENNSIVTSGQMLFKLHYRCMSNDFVIILKTIYDCVETYVIQIRC